MIKQAYKNGHIVFHFMETPYAQDEHRRAFSALQAYTNQVLQTKDRYTAALEIILIVVKAEAIQKGHEETAWMLLNAWAEMDSQRQSQVLINSPDESSWAYCLFDQRFFVNISSPEHILRKSRNLGTHLVLVMQLRDGIDYIAPPNHKGDAVRGLIRKRINCYDHIGVSADLATHGQGENRDWKQFWLGDEEAGRDDLCPLEKNR